MAGEQQAQAKQPRASTVVVTSETLAGFQAKKLNLESPTTKPEDSNPPPASGEGEKKGEAAPADGKGQAEGEGAEGGEEGKESDAHGLNKRFSKLTAQRKAAETERDAARSDVVREREAREAE